MSDASLLQRLAGRMGISRDVALLTGSAVFSQGMTVLAAPILTRLYTPAELGVFGAFWAVATVLSIAAGLRYDFAIPLPERERDGRGVFWISILVSVPVCLIASTGFWLWLSHRPESLPGVSRESAILLFVTLVILGAGASVRFWGVRIGAFGALSRITLRQAAVRAVVSIGGGVAGTGWLGLLAGEVVARLVGIWELGRDALKVHRGIELPDRALLRRLALRYRRSPLVILPSHLADALASAAVIPLALRDFGAVNAGLLLLVQRLVSAPAALLGTSVADVFHSESAAAVRSAPGTIAPLFRATVAKLAIFATVLLLPVALLAPLVFGFVFGEEWGEAGALTAALTPWTWAAFVISPVSRILTVVRHESWKLWYDALALAGLFGAFFVARLLAFEFVVTVLVVSLVQALAYGVFALILWRAVRRPGVPPGNEGE